MAKTRGTLKFYDMNSPEIEATTAGQQTEYKGRKGRGTLTFTEIEPIPMPETTVKPETEEDAASGGGAQKDNKKFDAGQYAGDAGRLFLNGVAEGFAATGAAVENWIGKGLDKLFPGAGFEGSGLFNVLYNGRPDWKWAGENGLVGIKQDREYNQESLQENADRIDSKVLKKAAEFGGDIAYGLGNAAPMAATAMATGGASAAASLTKEGLMKTGAEVVEKSGVLNSMSQAARDMLTSRDYWTSFASEVGMDYYDALDSGATEDEALRYALSSAGLNSVIEIGGGIQKIPEKPTFRTWLKSAHEEGMEEIQQGTVSRLLENVVYNKGNPIASVTDENAVLNPVTALGEYAGGAAVGGILSGGQQLTQRGINNAQYKRAYGTSAQDLVKESLEMNPDNALATKLQKKLEAGKKLTGSELRQLVEQNETDIMDGDRATIQTAVEDRLTELGETENVPQVAEAIARQAAGERITDAEKTLLEGSERARQVRQELNPENIRVGATDEAWTGQIGTERINRAAYNRGIQENGVTGAKYNPETQKLDAIVKDSEGNIQTVPLKEAKASPMQEELFDWAEDLKEAGPVMVGAYQATQNLELYAKSFRLAYEYGKAHVPMDYVENSEAVNYLHPVQLKLAYEEGVKAQQRQTQAAEKKINSGGTRTAAGKKKPAVSLRGATVGGTTYAPVDRKAMNRRQWASVEAMRTFSKATGVDVVFYQSQANEKGEYEGANGFYRDGTIYLDINAGRNRTQDVQEMAVLKTAAHELTHFIQQNSPTQYEELKQFVVERLVKQEGVSFEDLVTDKQVREPELSYNEAVDELVADACEMMLKDSKAAEQLAKENRSLARRIADWLRKWVRSIKTAMEDLKAERPESVAMMQYAEELQKLWDEALVTAARNNRGVGTGRAQYSIRTMDGETMTVLDTENDTRSFDAAEEYLKALVDTEHPFATILADAQPVYIGKDLPGEYRSSEYTKGMEAKLRPVKMQAATNLDEMLLLAENGEWRENVKDKHKTDAQNGWYRYDARFAVPILNEKKAVDHYTVYGGTLLIRNDADGKSYLYDLVDIKREKRISTASFSARGHSEVLAPKPSQTQYMQNAEGSQAEKSGQMQERSIPQINGSSGKSGAQRGNASVNSIRQLSDNSQEENFTKVQKQQREPRLPDRDYSYDALTRKTDMTLTVVNDRVKYQPNSVSRKNILEWGIANGKKVGRSNENGNAVVRVKDTGEEVILSKAGLRHGLDRRFAVNAPVVLRAGEILQNAIRINELTPKKDTVDASYVLVGAAKNKNNEPYIVQFVVNRASNEVTSVDVLYAINAKKEPAALLPEITGEPATLTDSSISISNLLDYVNRYFPDILPEDVLKHYGHDARPAGELGESALFQQRESRLSDRDVLRMAARMAGSDRSNRWAVEDKNRLELLESRMLLLDEINAELAALQEERATILSGRKKSELKGEDRNELIKTENRIQIAKDQIEREEARAFNLVSMDVYKPLLKKARSIVEQDAATRARTEYREKAEERQRYQVLKKRLERTTSEWKRMLLKPTKDRYAPEELVRSCLEVAMMLDESGPREGTKSKYRYETTSDALAYMKKQYDALADSEDQYYRLGYDKELSELVEKLRKALDGKAIRDLTYEEAGDVAQVLVSMQGILKDARYQIGNLERISTQELVDSAVRQMLSTPERSKTEAAADAVARQSASVMRNIRRMCQYNDNAALYKLFRQLEEGVKKKDRFIMEANKLFDRFAGERMLKSATELKTYHISGVDMNMTEMEVMQLILSAKREQSDKTRHLEGKGFIVPDLKLMRKGKGQDAISKGQELNKTFLKDILQLEDGLDAWAKDYMHTASEFFNGMARNAINEATVQTKHRRMAVTKDYVPYEVDKRTVVKDIDGVKFDATIEGDGMLKSVVAGAQNPLIIRGLNTIVENHIERVGRIYGLAVPIRNFNKAYNAKSQKGQGMSMKEAIDRAWPAADTKLIEQAITDLQTSRERATDDISKLMRKAEGKFVEATLLSNISVTIKQAASYSTAGLYLSQKALFPYQATIAKLFAADNSAFAKKLFAEIDEHTPMHYMRRKGMSMEEAATIAQDNSKVVRWMDKKLPDVANPLKWIQNMDVATTAAIWLATKRQVELDGVKQSDPTYWSRVTELYEKVISETQPMYDSLHRPEVQKNKNEILRGLMMFRTQPLQNAGILYDAAGELAQAKKNGDQEQIKAAGRKFKMAVGSQVASLAVFATMTLLAYAVRNRLGRYRDDEEELTVVSIMKRVLGDMAVNGAQLIAPIGGGLIAGGIEKVITGSSYGGTLSIPTLDAINDWISQMDRVRQDIVKLSEDEEADIVTDSVDFAMDTAGVLGIPAKNAFGILRGIVGNITDLTGHELSWATDKPDPSMAIVKACFENGHMEKGREVIDQVIQSKMDAGKEEKEARSAVRSSLTAYYKKLYLRAYKKKNEKEMKRIRMVIQGSRMYDDNAADVAAGWVKEWAEEEKKKKSKK